MYLVLLTICFSLNYCNALIVNGGAHGTIIEPPANTRSVNFLPISTEEQGFDEQQCVTLASDLQCSDNITVPAGTQVASHFVFFWLEPGNNRQDSTWTFNREVLCLLSHRTGEGIWRSSPYLGLLDVLYISANQGNYGLETHDDIATFSGATVRFKANIAGQVDALRVITAGNCEPENSPPDCSGATLLAKPNWPPNHKMANMLINGVTDPDGDPVSILITSVSQDETAFGPGNPHCPDAVISGNTVLLRRERFGTGNGRVYAVTFTATDDLGASCTGTLSSFCVPHDQGNTTCVDDGPIYDSTICFEEPPAPEDAPDEPTSSSSGGF